MADRWAVFISSSMVELRDERAALYDLLNGDRMSWLTEGFMYEHDAPATQESQQELWRAEVQRCHVFLPLFWKKLGPWTRDEYDTATGTGKPIWAFVKVADPKEPRDPNLDEFLDSSGINDPTRKPGAATFSAVAELRTKVEGSLKRLLAPRDRAPPPPLGSSVAVGGLRAEATPDGFATSRARGTPRFAPRPPNRRRRIAAPRGAFAGRDREVHRVRRYLDPDRGNRLVAVAGPPASGRTTLLRHLAAGDPIDGYPDGTWLEPDPESLAGDLVTAVWELFYERDGDTVPTPADMAGALRDLRALIVLENVDGHTDQLEHLLGVMPASTFVATMDEPALDRPADASAGPETVAAVVARHGRLVRLSGLDDAGAVLQLFAARYFGEEGAAVPEQARADVLMLCKAAGNLPGAVRRIADAAENAAWETGPGPDPEHLIRWAHAAALQEDAAPAPLPEPFATLAAVGVPIPDGALARMMDVSELVEALGGNTLVATSPRYVVAPGLVDDATEATMHAAVVDAALEWAATATPEELFADRAFIEVVINWAAEAGRWSDVIALVARIEVPLALGARWGAWRRMLELGLEAAGWAGDARAAARMLHQLGVWEQLAGSAAVAVDLLRRAQEARAEMGERAAAKVTRRSLRQARWQQVRALPWGTVALGALTAALVLTAPGALRGHPPIGHFTTEFPPVVVPRQQSDPPPFEVVVVGPFDSDRVVSMSMTATGDADLCVYRVAGKPVLPVDACLLGPGTVHPLAAPAPAVGLVPGQPVAAAADEACEPSRHGDDTARFSVPRGTSCHVTLRFDPRDPEPRTFAGQVVFDAGADSFDGTLRGRTVLSGDMPGITVSKLADADGDGTYGGREHAVQPGDRVTFRVLVANNDDEPFDLLRIVDSQLGAPTCREGALPMPVPAGGTTQCTYEAAATPFGVEDYQNVATAVVATDDGSEWARSGLATVAFAGPVEVELLVDADGDGRFTVAEAYPPPDPGPVPHRVAIRGDPALRVASLQDAAGADLTALPGSTCRAGLPLPYTCSFGVTVDPAAPGPHRTTVAVRLDPPLASPYEAAADIRPVVVDVAKSVDADGDGEFSPDEATIAGEGLRQFEVTVGNHFTQSLVLEGISDSAAGDLAAFGCEMGTSIPPGGTYDCRFTAPVAAGEHSWHLDTVTASLRGPSFTTSRTSNPAVVRFHRPTTLDVVEPEAPEGAAQNIELPVTVQGTSRPVVLSFEAAGATSTTCGEGVRLSPGGRHACAVTVRAGGDAGAVVGAGELALTVRGGPESVTVEHPLRVAFANVRPSLRVQVDGPATAAAGATVPLEVTVTNRSVATDPVDIAFPGGHCPPGQALAPGRSNTCRFLYPVGQAAGEDVVRVAARATDDERSTATAAGTHAIRVLAPPRIEVEVETVPASSVEFVVSGLPAGPATVRHGQPVVVPVSPGDYTVALGGPGTDPALWSPAGVTCTGDPGRDTGAGALPGSAAYRIAAGDGHVSCTFRYVGVTGVVDVTPEYLAFGEVAVGDHLRLDVTVANVGTATAHLSITAAPPGFTVANGCADVQPGATCALGVTFAPAEADGGVPRLGFVEWAGPGGDDRVLVSGTGR